jgi:chromosome segregation ATPase
MHELVSGQFLFAPFSKPNSP